MEYTSLFEPMLCICLCLCLGFLIGCISTLCVTAKENKAINEELEAKNIELQEWIDRWKKIYDVN